MTGLWIMIIVLIVLSIAAVGLVHYLEESTAITAGTLIICVVLSSLLVWWNWNTTYKNDHWATCHVTDKDRGGDNGSYRIYTSDCGQLANEDSMLRGKFNSADFWQEIPDEGVVRFRIAGSRIGFFSQFPNVFDVEKVEQ